MRANRIRAKINGTKEKPRVSVFKSNQYTHVQVIDDENHKILSAGHTMDAKGKKIKGTKTEKALTLGEVMGEKMKELGIKEAMFDKGSAKYHGRVKEIAEGLRRTGIKI